MNQHNVPTMKLATLCVLLVFLSAPVWGQAQDEKIGDQFRITLFHQSESKGENGSSSSSSGGHEYLEQILALRDNGVERLYEIAEPDDKARLINWQFPVRIFEASNGSMKLLNRGELEERRDAWLKAAEIPVDACGTWYFTWNAFQVECDPDAILETIRAIKIQPDHLIEGATFSHPAAIDSGRLQSVDGESHTFSVDMAANEDYFHRADAQSDVIVGKIMGKPISFEEAYAKRKAEQVTGTIEVILRANAQGRVWKRTISIEKTKTEAGGEVEREVMTETVERARI
ncbi:hypothetical protein [Sphingopyxis sp. PAMC25046]|uniref:hypothetical protein n=1 Tax=Sphingopyxis sp. PAMC25046 TaxID=2565556 RepID=UPI001447E0F4|nr:hypothetical protein [Sphingopyxis sp. PAMC25046]